MCKLTCAQNIMFSMKTSFRQRIVSLVLQFFDNGTLYLLIMLAFLSSSVSSSEDISSMNLGEYRPPSVSSSGTFTSTAVDLRNRSTLRMANFTSLSHSVSSGRSSVENSNALDERPASSSPPCRITRTFSLSRYESRTKKSPSPDRARALKHSVMSPCKHALLADDRYGSASSSAKLPSQLNRFLPLLFPSGPPPDALLRPVAFTFSVLLSGNDMD